ncbi:response regulator [Campylobacter curvus]|uniref:response regulator n=1 Tax=Campylobacter curvus TaxID=200 RepID=UPI00147033BE
MRLLIVEDDDELRATLKDSAEKYVKQIFKCSNAKDALVCFKQNDINLILSDINMLRMSEPKMASLIRQDDKKRADNLSDHL